MTSHLSPRFRRDFDRLPVRIKEQARGAYQLFQANPDHPGLEFKKLPPHDELWSVRVNNQYRAIDGGTGKRSFGSSSDRMPNMIDCYRNGDSAAMSFVRVR